MKKLLPLLFIYFFIFASCDTDIEVQGAKEIAGTWVTKTTNINIKINNKDASAILKTELEKEAEIWIGEKYMFNKNGKFEENSFIKDIGYVEENKMEGTFKMDGSKITFTYEEEFEGEPIKNIWVRNYSLKDDVLTLSNDITKKVKSNLEYYKLSDFKGLDIQFVSIEEKLERQ